MFNIYIILFLILKIRLKLYKCIVMDILGFLIILCVFENKNFKIILFCFCIEKYSWKYVFKVVI